MPSFDDLCQHKSIFDTYNTETIMVTYVPTNQMKEYRIGTRVRDVIPPGVNAIAALSNNEILSLSASLDISCRVEPILKQRFEENQMGNHMAIKIFVDTLTTAMQAAAQKVFPHQPLECIYIMGAARWFRFPDMTATESDCARIKYEMVSLIKRALPIQRIEYSNDDALSVFRAQNHMACYNLVASRNMPRVAMACIGDPDHCDAYCGASCGASAPAPADGGYCFVTLWNSTLCHNTSELRVNLWNVGLYNQGIMLTHTTDFETLATGPYMGDALLQQRLNTIMFSYKNWADSLKAPNVAAINEMTINRALLKDFIITCEYRHEKQISEVSARIGRGVRCVFVAGPSSSSKTTFANRLAVHLRTRNFQPIRVSLDDFYTNAADMPRDEKSPGKPDFEHLESLDLARIRQCLSGLLGGERVTMAAYNFITQTSGNGKKLRLPDDGILIIEGIHALNNRITEAVPPAARLRIFIQPVGNLVWNESTVFESVDTRLIRRMCRDYCFRGKSADETLRMWPNVRDGENKWILCNQTNSDLYFNSSILYELLVLKVYALPLLATVPQSSENFSNARRLIKLLEPLMPIPASLVPEMSLLCEFLPTGSMYEDFFF